jgi:hypothetical protein
MGRKGTHQNDTIEPLLEPSHGVIPPHSVLVPNTCPSLLSSSNTRTRTAHHNVEVHSEDTDSRIVSGTKVDVLLDTETEVTGLREVLPTQLILLHFETTLKNLLCLRPTDSDVDSNLLVTTDTECTDGVASFRCDGCLTGELFEDLGCTGETITRLANTDV